MDFEGGKMAGYLSTRLKRKELDDVSDDFSDFSLSSPARKIRRLGGELPPIMEEEEAEMSLDLESQVVGDTMLEELPRDISNEERAIVLFNPMTPGLVHSPSSISVSSDLISRFKNDLIWSQRSPLKLSKEEDDDTTQNKKCLAVIPWVPSQAALGQRTSQSDASPMVVMDVEEDDTAEAMEIEDMGSNSNLKPEQANGFGGGMIENEGLHQWHQQQCMTPHLPVSSTSTPLIWYR